MRGFGESDGNAQRPVHADSDGEQNLDKAAKCADLSAELGGVTVLQKGAVDVVAHGEGADDEVVIPLADLIQGPGRGRNARYVRAEEHYLESEHVIRVTAVVRNAFSLPQTRQRRQ